MLVAELPRLIDYSERPGMEWLSKDLQVYLNLLAVTDHKGVAELIMGKITKICKGRAVCQ